MALMEHISSAGAAGVPATPPGVRSVPDRVLGVVGGAMIIAAVLLLLFGGESDGGVPVAPGAPGLSLIAPAPGSTVENPIEMRFRTDATIQRMPGGWGIDRLHLHAEVNGRELMPGPTDIERQQDGSYLWRLGNVPTGDLRLRLFWSNEAHQRVTESMSDPVEVRVGTP